MKNNNKNKKTDKKKTSKARKVWRAAGIAVGVILLAVVVYLCYVLFSYSRIEDKIPLEVNGKGVSEKAEIGKEYTAFSNNVGFGAYTPDFTFFLDGGKESWAESKSSVIRCINLAAEKAESFDPDFILLQEVDTDSTRSYHIDQAKQFTDYFTSYSSVFAVNYHSAFLMYPIFEPHGSSNSGILTLSRITPASSLRRSLKISDSLSKLLDLDRCYSVSRIPTDDGKELVLYNVHLSAYGGSDEIRTSQMSMLFGDMQSEYEKGNYCVCGGDFNHDFTGTSVAALNGEGTEPFGWTQPFPSELLPKNVSRAIDYTSGTEEPTCRNCDVPYKKGNFTVIVDGFLVTDNVKVTYVENVQTEFEYSDHNPVVIKFILGNE